MSEHSEFHGIRRTTSDSSVLWSRDLFPRSLSVALANHFGDRGTPLNLIHTDDRGTCRVGEVNLADVYGCPTDSLPDMTFDFDSVYEPFAELASGVPESDLVLRDGRGLPLGHMEIQTSVIPDASTKGMDDDLMGPEITVRTSLLELCALSIASDVVRERDSLHVLESGIPQDTDWSDWEQVSQIAQTTVVNLDILERRFHGRQSPFLLQAVWKSEDNGPFMAEDAMDVFVWTDFALTRLFLDSTRKSSDGSPTRPLRSAVRVLLILTSILRGENPDLDSLIRTTSYGIPGNKEFMVNGKMTNRYMSCPRLTRPKASRLDVTFLASKGFEDMIEPERRLDLSVYQAVRSVRGDSGFDKLRANEH